MYTLRGYTSLIADGDKRESISRKNAFSRVSFSGHYIYEYKYEHAFTVTCGKS